MLIKKKEEEKRDRIWSDSESEDNYESRESEVNNIFNI